MAMPTVVVLWGIYLALLVALVGLLARENGR
jgi:hypothetical protein